MPTEPGSVFLNMYPLKFDAPGPDQYTFLDVPMPRGRAEASFYVDTGRDLNDSPERAPVWLFLRVRSGDLEQQRFIADCRFVEGGDVFGGGTKTLLEIEICGAMFWLETNDGFVMVSRIEGADGQDKRTVVSVPLPPGVRRAVPPKDATRWW